MPLRMFRYVLVLLVAFAAAGRAPAQSTSGELARAAALIKERRYQDAARVLLEDMRSRSDEAAARHNLLLGECYYMLKEYDKARPCFAKALRYLEAESEKIVAEYRMACVAFRLGDYAAAAERIDAFIARYPTDPRVGRLLVFKMMIVRPRGKPAEKLMEEMHARIYADIRKYEYSTGMEADQILCDFYRETGQPDKVEALYTRIVHNARRAIADLEKDRQPVPQAFEKSHDNAALQLGALAWERKQFNDAMRWLENVRYDAEMKLRARIMLAQIAYARGDYAAAVAYLTEKNLLENLPASLKSDVYLLLGLCEKARPDGSAGKVEEYLKQVGQDSRGYLQAQAALGDIYHEKGLSAEALRAFEKVVNHPEYAPNALLKMAQIHIAQADRTPDRAKAAELNSRAGQLVGTLLARYPLTTQAKEAKALAEQLLLKGVEVTGTAGGQQQIKAWEQIARERPGSVEAAQALMSLIRLHFKAVIDEKTRKMTRAPDYAACAAAADRLLDGKTYTGAGMSEAAWKAMKAEALYHRGVCELASISPPRDQKPGEAMPVYLPKASATAAIGYFTAARQHVDARQLDLVKGIELGLLEAMFKSDRKEDKEAAERRFAELEGDYGNDVRFQKLAMDLAEWYRAQGRLAEAARQLAGVADRGKDLPEEELLKLLYTAGSLYSRAGYEAQHKRGDAGYCVYIYPRETVAIRDDLLKSYAPLQRTVNIAWPRGGANITAGEAVAAISRASGIPFVWPTAKGPNTIAGYLESRRLDLKDGRYTVEQALSMVLDPKVHRVFMDIGLADSPPTIPRPKIDADDPDADRAVKVLEIYDVAQAGTRLRSLARPYGQWQRVHDAGGGKRAAGGVMLYHVLKRIEEVAQVQFVWAEGIDKQEKLAFEFKQPPGNRWDGSCAEILAAALEAVELKYRVARREAAAEYYEAAKDCFNKVRRIDPKSKFGEKALFNVALNYYNLRDYARMKAVLREYLRVFDNPDSEYYHDACFWVGWTLENERKYREACAYYARAAEERLIIVRRDAAARLDREALRKRLSYDTQFALGEEISGSLQDASLDDLARFVRVNCHVDVRIDPSARAADVRINRPSFRNISGFDLLCGVLDEAGLSFNVENVNREVAERAYYRLALAYRKDGLMQQALENCNLLLERYPATSRRRDATRLLLEIYRGLKDYRSVLATLEELRRTAPDDAERRQLDIEIAGIYFDMADYAKAAEAYRNALSLAGDARQATAMRDGYARALFRMGNFEEALKQYEILLREDTGEVAAFIDTLLVFYCKFALGRAEQREFPEAAARFIQKYEQLTEAQRSRLAPDDFARAMWVYYIMGLMDLKKGRTADALERLSAAATAPDDILAGEAGVLTGLLHMKAGDHEKAKDAFEYLLFSTKSSESTVRAMYYLGVTLNELGRRDQAVERFRQLLQRYPASPFAREVEKSPLYAQVKAAMTAPPPEK